jgi:hypothetical protein
VAQTKGAGHASATAQGDPTRIVTSNEAGDLAARTFSDLGLATQGDIAGVNNRVNRAFDKIDENQEGVAVSIALSDPDLYSGQTFAMKGNWGTFEGANALGFTAKGLIAENVLGSRSMLTMSGGVGFGVEENTFGGRVSAQIGW